MKKILPWLTLSLSFAWSSAAFAVETPLPTLTQIRFGTDATFPPFEYKTPEGKLAGFDIDLGNALCEALHARCVWVENGFDGLIPALRAKKFDAILSSLSITDERKKAIDFSDKLFNTPAYLIAAKNSGLKPEAESLRGKRVGVQQGSVFETYAKKYWMSSGVDVVSYPSADAVYADLIVGRLDATLDDAVVVSQSLLDKPQGKDFALIQPQVKDDTIFGPGTGIGVPKENAELLAALNQAINQIRNDGTYDRLAKKYFNFNIYGK